MSFYSTERIRRPTITGAFDVGRAAPVVTWLTVCLAVAVGGFTAPSRTKAAKVGQRAVDSGSSSSNNPSDNNVPNHVIRHGDRESSMVALTFDDAPFADTLPALLALLRAENVKATFFLIGQYVERHPELARAIVADGHEVGNHSYSHRDLQRASPTLVEKEIAATQKLIHEVIGTTSTFFRPPFGNVSDEVKRICQREGISIVCWNVDPADWRKDTTRDSVVRNVLENATSGSIVLLHATQRKTIEALVEIIPILRQRGFQLVKLSDLLRDRAHREEMRSRAVGHGQAGTSSPGLSRSRTKAQVGSGATSFSLPALDLPLP